MAVGVPLDELKAAMRAYSSPAAASALSKLAPQGKGPAVTASSSSPSASSGKAQATPSAGKLRVLCLHGYVQNADIFRAKTGSVRKIMKGCDFEFVDAPHSAAGAFPGQAGAAAECDAAAEAEGGVGPRGWWNAGENKVRTSDEEWVRPAQAYICDGWDSSLEWARSQAEALGPFDGLLAFSQGCAVATALLREATEGKLEPLARARFALLVGGFVPRDPAVAAYLRGSGPLAVRSLHVTGLADELVPRQRSEELAEIFDPAQRSWLEHPGRHGLPSGTGATKDALQRLLSDLAPQ